MARARASVFIATAACSGSTLARFHLDTETEVVCGNGRRLLAAVLTERMTRRAGAPRGNTSTLSREEIMSDRTQDIGLQCVSDREPVVPLPLAKAIARARDIERAREEILESRGDSPRDEDSFTIYTYSTGDVLRTWTEVQITERSPTQSIVNVLPLDSGDCPRVGSEYATGYRQSLDVYLFTLRAPATTQLGWLTPLVEGQRMGRQMNSLTSYGRGSSGDRNGTSSVRSAWDAATGSSLSTCRSGDHRGATSALTACLMLSSVGLPIAGGARDMVVSTESLRQGCAGAVGQLAQLILSSMRCPGAFGEYRSGGVSSFRWSCDHPRYYGCPRSFTLDWSGLALVRISARHDRGLDRTGAKCDERRRG